MKQTAISALLEDGLGDMRVVLTSDMGCSNENIVSTTFLNYLHLMVGA